MYHIRDRVNTGYLQSHHAKVDHNNVDFIKFPNADSSWRWWAAEEVKAGDNLAYSNMHSFAVNNDLSIDANYQNVIDQLDFNELVNYLIAHVYFNNGDWPENNIKIWKERTEKGKWRWALYDLDHIVWRTAHKNTTLFDEFMNETDPIERRNPKTTEFYRSLFNNQSFKNEFVQRMNTYMHTVWEYNRTNAIFQDIKNEVGSEIEPDYTKWGGWDFNQWNTDIDKLDLYFQERPNYARTMIKDVLGLGSLINLSLSFNANSLGSVLMHQNFFKVPHNFSGTYFNDLEMYVHAIPKPGYRFVEWQEISNTAYKYDQNLYKFFGSNKTLTPVFEPAFDLVINEIHYNPAGTSEAEEFIELYNPDSEAKSLWGYQFTDGIQFQFPENSIIQPGEYIIIANNDSAYINNGYQVFEWDCGSLDNDGEALVFSNPAKEVIDSVYYNDNIAWNQNADGLGFSLALLNNVSDNNVPTSWSEQRPSLAISPGRQNDFCVAMQNAPTITHVSCFGANDGFIINNVTGGTAPLSYSWNNGQSNNIGNNLSAGLHILTTTDVYNCTRIDSFRVNEPVQLQATTSITNETYYQANDGTVTVTASGGTAPYSYSWSNGANSSMASNLAAGNYSITVTDNNFCSVTEMITINPIVCNTLTVTVDIENETCFGDNDASLTVNGVQNGTPPYSILWSTGSTTSTLNNLSGGNYQLDLTDVNGCPFIGSYTVSDATALSVNALVTNASSSTINDGSIDITVNGGTAPYSFYWSNNATTEDANNLAMGNYWLSITDANNCQLMLNNLLVGNNCVSNLVYTNQPQHVSGIYQVSDYVRSNGLIGVGENVSFKADDYIELSNLFEVVLGAEFEALIDGCN